MIKNNFRTMNITRGKEGHFIIINESILHEKLILNMYAFKCNFETHEQKLTQVEEGTSKFKMTVGNFNTSLSVTDRRSKQKINKYMEDLKSIINQLLLIDICK